MSKKKSKSFNVKKYTEQWYMFGNSAILQALSRQHSREGELGPSRPSKNAKWNRKFPKKKNFKKLTGIFETSLQKISVQFDFVLEFPAILVEWNTPHVLPYHFPWAFQIC